MNTNTIETKIFCGPIRTLAILMILLGTTQTAMSQWSEGGNRPIYLERNQLQLNLLLPSISYEFAIMRNLSAGAGIGLGLATPTDGYSLAPSYLVFSRYYHNLKRRAGLNKNVSGNSGNYFAISFNHYFVEWEVAGNLDNEGRDLVFLGGMYGFQRTYKSGFGFGIEAGAGHYFRNLIGNGLGPAVNFRVSWNPFARRKAKARAPWPPPEKP